MPEDALMPRPVVHLRPCRADDLDHLEAWAPTGNSRTHAARFARQQAGTSTFCLAVAPQLADGFVGSAEIRWDGNANPEVPRCPEVNGLQVWPEELQSRGIGSAMLALLEQEARSRGHAELGLGVGRTGPLPLYLRLGYEDTGVTYLDRYTWIDEDHREHHVAAPCRWLTKTLEARP
jgi:GNAT superfamily N-acetyltransferase